MNRLMTVLFALACMLYANTITNGFVYDDAIVVSENTIVQKGLKGIPELLTTPRMKGRLAAPNDTYRPLPLVLLAIEYQVFEMNPMPGHLVNILVYGFCVVLLFLFIHRLFDGQKMVVAFITALLFAFHPIHTEVVANIKSSDELLCFFFAFLSLILFMNYTRLGRWPILLLGSASLFLAFLSKETVIAFLAVVPFTCFFYCSGDKRRALLTTVATVLIAVVYIAIRSVVLKKYNADHTDTIDFMDNILSAAPSAASRIATGIVVMGRYLRMMVVPYPLLSTYSYRNIPFASFTDPGCWTSLLAYTGIAGWAIWRWTRNRSDAYAYGVFLFIATLFLFSNIPFLIGAEFAERFAFFASAGCCLVAALAIEQWLAGKNIGVKAVINIKVLAVLMPVLLVFGTLTVARNMDWKSNYALFKNDADNSPNDSRLQMYIAIVIMNNLYPHETDSVQRTALEDESMGYLKKAVAIYPGCSGAYELMGDIYERRHMHDSAKQNILLALTSKHATAVDYNNEGTKYYNSGSYPLAISLLRTSILMAPGVKFPHYTLANCFLQTKEYDSAIVYYKKVLVLDSSYIDAHKGAALAYYNMQQYDSAEHHLKQALTIDPRNTGTLNTLGNLYFNWKKYPLAVEEFRQVTAIDKKNVDAWSNMGLAYYNLEQYAGAIDAYNSELSADPNITRDLPNLANSYKYAGNTAMALKYEATARQFFPTFRLDSVKGR